MLENTATSATPPANGTHRQDPSAGPPGSRDAHAGPKPKRPGLELRHVTRMSRELGKAVATCARHDGVTAGAFVRRILLERVGVHSAMDARSGRPVHRPPEEVAAISAAIRELAAVNRALAANDGAAARAGLDDVRQLLIPLIIARATR